MNLMRRLPGAVALASIIGLVVAVVALPWAERGERSSGGLVANLPWLFGGSNVVEAVAGTFSNGWVVIGLAVMALLPALWLLQARRAGGLLLVVLGIIGALFLFLTLGEFNRQFDVANVGIDVGSGPLVGIVSSLGLLVSGLLARFWPRPMVDPGLGRITTIESLAGDRDRLDRERSIRWGLMAAAGVSVLIAAAIVFVLLSEAWVFVSQVDWSKTWEVGWFPRRGFYDLPTLIFSTVVVTGIAMAVAIPFGLGVAIYLSEYASPRLRAIIKPVVEILAGIPTVVLGFFALLWLSPQLVQRFADANQGNLTAAGLGVGIVIIPLIASVAEDALAAVPTSLRMASAGLGSRKATTTLSVVLPAASSGIVAAMIIAVSRAFGETMVVFMAGGAADTAVRTFNPLDGSLTMTAAMASLAGGTDSVVGEALTQQSLYFVGLLLFIITMTLNIVANRIVRRTRETY